MPVIYTQIKVTNIYEGILHLIFVVEVVISGTNSKWLQVKYTLSISMSNSTHKIPKGSMRSYNSAEVYSVARLKGDS